MAETRKYTKSGRRAILDANNLIAQAGENTIVCVPIAALEVARGLIRERGYWRTTYAMEYDDAFYTLPDDTNFDIIKGILDEFLEGTNRMDCTEFTNELNDIEQAIKSIGGSGGCGCGSGGAGDVEPPIETLDTGDITEETGTPPDGYTSWEQYQSVKCDIATWLVQNFLDDIRWWQSIQIATLTLGGLATGMVSLLSAFTLTAVLAGLLAILAYEIAALNDLESVVADNFDDLVCDIMTGSDAQSSIDAFISSLNTLIDAKVADPVSEFLLKQLASYWNDTTGFNLLYAEFDDVIARQIPSGADCESCGVPCTNFFIQSGTWLGGLEFDSQFTGNAHRIEIWFNSVDGVGCDVCGSEENVSLVTVSGHTNHPDRNNFQIWSQNGACVTGTPDVYDSNTQPTLSVQRCQRFFSFVSNTAWTMTVDRHGGCV